MEKKIKYSKELNFNSEAKRNFIDYIKKKKEPLMSILLMKSTVLYLLG